METKVYLNELSVYVSTYDDGSKSVSILAPVWNKETKSYDTLRVSARGIRVIRDKEVAYEI